VDDESGFSDRRGRVCRYEVPDQVWHEGNESRNDGAGDWR
jgi:hypothetical protein